VGRGQRAIVVPLECSNDTPSGLSVAEERRPRAIAPHEGLVGQRGGEGRRIGVDHAIPAGLDRL